MQLMLRSLPFRTLIGLAAGVATMGFVLASALTAPNPENSVAISKCPSRAEHSGRTAANTPGAATPHAHVAVEAAP